ncbi:MAG: hypothetical protein AB1486_05995 [Planctomycetota bacterium]
MSRSSGPHHVPAVERLKEAGHRHLLPLGLAMLLSASCSGSFKGAGTPSAAPADGGEGPPPLGFVFGDGSTELSRPLGDIVKMTLTLPADRFTLVIDEGTQEIDLSRLRLTSSLALGDPGEGGIPAGESWMPYIIENDMVDLVLEDGANVLDFNLDTLRPIVLPTGEMTLAVTVRSDQGGEEQAALRLELLATDRPSVTILFERPPAGETPLGIELPRDAGGIYLLGATRPFALVVRATPDPETRAGFDLAGGAVFLVCAGDLGDPALGGLPAGTDLGSLIGDNMDVIVDPETGITTSGYTFQDDSPFLPEPGIYTFRGFVTDREGSRSFEQSAVLEVLEPVFLDPDVAPVLQASCAQIGCHDNIFQTEGLDLSSPERIFETTVLVDARQTDETTSCAPYRVTPFEPPASYLLHKVLGTHRDGCVAGRGQQMPLGRPPLDDADIERLRQWILQGAYYP